MFYGGSVGHKTLLFLLHQQAAVTLLLFTAHRISDLTIKRIFFSPLLVKKKNLTRRQNQQHVSPSLTTFRTLLVALQAENQTETG